MKIFNVLEEEACETPPVFNTAERKRYFTLPAGLRELAATRRTPTNPRLFHAGRRVFSRPAQVLSATLTSG